MVILAAKLMASQTNKNIFRKNLPGNISYKAGTGTFQDRPSYFVVYQSSIWLTVFGK
jgi:hypothetical protein